MAKKKKKSMKKAPRKAATRATTKKRTPKGKAAKKSAKMLASPKSQAGQKLPGKKKSGKIASVKTGRTEKAAVVRAPKKSRGQRESTLSSEMLGPDSAGQSGDLQGLSKAEGADSESVDELIEEGNAFEAGIVAGVEESGERGMKEVRTREVPEDDVPGEYLDEE